MKDKLVENIKNCISSAILNEVSSSLMRRAAAKQRQVIADKQWQAEHTEEDYLKYMDRAERFEDYADELTVSEEVGDYLYHATPSCYLASIKKYGLGGKMPKKRFWDYGGTPYENIKIGFFVATDEYVAASYLEASEDFEQLAEDYEDRYGKPLEIIVFKIPVNKIDNKKLSVDNNLDVDYDHTFFYNGIVDFKDMEIIEI